MNLRNFFVGRAIVFTIILIILGIVAAFYGLNSYIYNEKQGDTNQNQPPVIVAENPDGEADPNRMTLDMTVWKWQYSLYGDGREIRPIAAKLFTIKFEKNGEFQITTDCNNGSGTYTTNGSNITFLQIVSTEMFCADSLESAFKIDLQNVSTYHFTGRGELILDIKFDSGSMVFR